MTGGMRSVLKRRVGRLYARVPEAADRALTATFIRVRSAWPRRMTLERVIGRESHTGQPLTVLVADRTPSVDYFLERLFGQNQCIERIARVARRSVRNRLPGDADLVIVRGPRRWTDRRFDDCWWHVPEAVGAVIRLTGVGDQDLWNNRSNANNLRRIERHGLTGEVSHDEADFAFFYHHVYRPFTIARYGEQFVSRSEHRMLRCFRRGGLIWVRQGERRLAATLFSAGPSGVRSWILAADPQYPDAVKLGALSATYLFTLRWALDHGHRAVDLGAARPMLVDGVLSHKKYWGATLRPEPGVDHDLLFHWPRLTAPIAQFLHASPLIVRDGDGLSGLTAMPGDAPADPARTRIHLERSAMRGLARMHIVAGPPWRFACDHVREHAVRWVDAVGFSGI